LATRTCAFFGLGEFAQHLGAAPAALGKSLDISGAAASAARELAMRAGEIVTVAWCRA
jgi:hypothetical protein